MSNHRLPSKPSQISASDKKLRLRNAVRSELWKRYRNSRAEAHEKKRKLELDDVPEATLVEALKSDLSKFSKNEDWDDFSDRLTVDEIIEEFENDLVFQTQNNYFEDIDETDSSHTNEVLCPICQRGYLILEMSDLHCNRIECEMKLNVEQDYNSLNSVRCQLAVAHSEHSETCRCSPVFCVEENFGIFNLLMIGSKCDFFHIVI